MTSPVPSPPSDPLKGFLDECMRRLSLGHSAQIREIEQKADTQLSGLLANLSEGQMRGALEIVRQRRSLLNTSPAYNNEVVNISKQLLTFGGAGLALAAAFAKDVATLPPAV